MGAHRTAGPVLREYLLRGGFLMADDLHGTYEWDVLRGAHVKFFQTGPSWKSRMPTPSFTRFTT